MINFRSFVVKPMYMYLKGSVGYTKHKVRVLPPVPIFRPGFTTTTTLSSLIPLADITCLPDVNHLCKE